MVQKKKTQYCNPFLLLFFNSTTDPNHFEISEEKKKMKNIKSAKYEDVLERKKQYGRLTKAEVSANPARIAGCLATRQSNSTVIDKLDKNFRK